MNKANNFCHILVVEDEKHIKTYVLEENSCSIGRDTSNGIVINDVKVSRNHALITKKQESNEQYSYWIQDGDIQGNKSKNGLIVNGQLIDNYELKHGDLLRFSSKATASYYIVSNGSVVDFFRIKNPSTEEADAENNQYLPHTLPTNHDNVLAGEDLVRLASFPEFSPNPIIEIDMRGKITYLNAAANIKFANIKEIGTNHPLLVGLVENNQNRRGNLLVKEVEIEHEYFQEYIHYLAGKKLIRIYIFDLTARKQIELALRESEEKYRAVVSQISDSIFWVETEGKRIIEANPAYCNLLGYTSSEILDLRLQDVVHEFHSFINSLQEILKDKQNFLGEGLHRKKDGSLVDVEVSAGIINYSEKEIICFTVRDITSRKRTRELLQYQAFHDVLTGLPNRRLFNEQLCTSLANAKRYQHQMAVMYLDIDHFKKINDNFGHPAGDKLLETFAYRLKSCLRVSDTVSRFGGDEFAVLLPQVSSQDAVAKLAQRLMDALKQPFEIFDHILEIKSSIGIALYPQDAEDGETLLNRADVALLRSKNQGRNSYQFYNNINLSLDLQNLLPQALAKQEFYLRYQPIINLENLSLTGIESLLRWLTPQGKEILPQDFILEAEKTDIMLAIGEWVLRTACAQNKAWQEAGRPKLPVSVNISARELQQINFVAKLELILQQTNLEPCWLELAVTEKTLNLNNNQIFQNLQEVLALGVGLSLDDFGVGSCSVSHLKNFRFNTLKIHESFVAQMENNSQEKPMIAAIIALGRAFNVRVIAEGVETDEQLRLLRTLECVEIQGNIFQPPLMLEEFEKFLNTANYIN